ncbi:MAG: restriction endonuclease subunit S [Bacteroidales bacterium]|nr:restriction endonuclease subunit S [Bacteroidales bacterium]
MERKLINSVVNGILRNGYDSEATALSGIALWLCRQVKPSVKDLIGQEQIDYEKLFADGEEAAQRIEKYVSNEQLGLLLKDVKLTVEILLLRSHGSASPAFPVSESASRFLFRLLEAKIGVVYNPFAGDYYAPERNPQITFATPTMDTNIARYALLHQAISGRINSVFYDFNPFLTPGDENVFYDYIYIPAMPFGIKIVAHSRKMEETYLLSAIKMLQPEGRMVFVLPAHSLSSDNFFELRKTILESRMLRHVVLMAPKTLTDLTDIATVAFVLENSRNKESHFYFSSTPKAPLTEDLCDKVLSHDPEVSVAVEYSAPFSTHNLQIINFSASTKRVDRPGFKYVKLGELLTPYSKSVELDGSELVARLSGKDMHLALPEYMVDIQDVELAPLSGRFTRIQESVLCFHGITQNYVWCVGEPDYPVYCNGDIYTYRISSNLISPEYLCFILGQEDIKADIKSRVGGGTIPRISRKALMEIEIPVPDRDRQDLITQDLQQFVSDQKTMLAQAEKRSHEATVEDITDDIEDKIHLLGPYNFDTISGINRIVKKLENGEKLEAGTKIFKDSEISLVDYLRGLRVKSQNAGYITASIGGSIFEEVKAPLDIFTFIQEYVAYLQSDDSYEGISFEITPIKRPCYLMITERTLRLVLDTIIRNAVSHGFPDGFSGPKHIKFTLDIEPKLDYAVLSVANNGVPVAEGFNLALYTNKFGKCGPTAHSGRGGHFVSRAMDFYNGYVVVNTSDKNWPFNVLLHIPVSHD